jgi:type I restriction enzyme S subunit
LKYDATAGGFISILRADPQKVHPRYLYFWFSSPRTQYSVRHCGRQTTNISNLSYDRCLTLEIPLPPFPEQRRIADVLDRADTIRRNRAAVERTLLDFPRRLFFEMFGDVVLNDHAWKQVAVADAGDVQLGRQRAPKYQTGKFTRPYMRVANVFDDRIDLSDVLSMDFDERDFKTYRLESGDILLNEGQSTELVGRPAMWQNELPDCCFQNTLIRFRADPNVTNPEFALAIFREYLHRGAFARISSKTSNVAHLGAGRFAAMPFPLPPREQQDHFAAARKKLRSTIVTAQKARQESDDLFASLIRRAFQGVL